MWLRHRRILIPIMAEIGMDPLFAASLVRTRKNARMRSSQSLSTPSRSQTSIRNAGRKLGNSIFAKVGLSANHLSRPFSDDGCAFFFSFEGDLSRIPKQKLREQSRVRRERSVGDHWDVSDIVMIFSRRDLCSPTFAGNRTWTFA